MAIELLNMSSVWAKIKAGFGGGKLYNSPARAPNPKGYTNGRGPLAEQAQMVSSGNQASPFTGKSFNVRK